MSDLNNPHELPKFKSPAEYRASARQIKDRMDSYNEMKAKMKARKGYRWSYDAPLANVPDQTFKRKEDKLGGRRKNKKRKHRKTRKGRRKKKRKGGLNLSGCEEGKVRTRHGCGIRWNANPLSNPLGCCREAGAMPSFWGGRRKKTRKGRRKSRQHGGLMTRGTATKTQVKPTIKTTHTTHLSKSLRRSSIIDTAKKLVGGKRKKKKFRKGSKSKTHRGKDFETRKTSKNYNSKRWKRMTGRRTMRAPLFPFV